MFEIDDRPSFSVTEISRQDCELIQDYVQPRNLFDSNQPYRRKITVDALEEKACTIEEFNAISNIVVGVDELVIVDRETMSDNKIIRDYEETKLKSYVLLFKRKGVKKITVVKLAN